MNLNSTPHFKMNSTLSPNTTVTDYEEDQKYFTDWFVSLVIAIYLIVLFAGVAGNFLTLAVIIVRKTMRRSIHIYTFNLAVADIFILLFYVPTQIYFTKDQGKWRMGSFMCKIACLMVPLNLFASIGTLIAISIDRHEGLTKPFEWRAKSLRNAKITLPIIWVVSLACSVPVFYYSDVNIYGYCQEHWPSSVSEVTYWTIIMLLQYIFPMFFILGIHVRMVYKMSQDKLSINKLHMRMVKMVIALMLIYLVCNGLQHVIFFLSTYTSLIYTTSYGPYMFIVSNLVISVQAALNPFIYGASRNDFKSAYLNFIQRMSRKVGVCLFNKDTADHHYSLQNQHSSSSNKTSDTTLLRRRTSSMEEEGLTPNLFRKSYTNHQTSLAPPISNGVTKSHSRERLDTLAFIDTHGLEQKLRQKPKSNTGLLKRFRNSLMGNRNSNILEEDNVSDGSDAIVREAGKAPEIIITDDYLGTFDPLGLSRSTADSLDLLDDNIDNKSTTSSAELSFRVGGGILLTSSENDRIQYLGVSPEKHGLLADTPKINPENDISICRYQDADNSIDSNMKLPIQPAIKEDDLTISFRLSRLSEFLEKSNETCL